MKIMYLTLSLNCLFILSSFSQNIILTEHHKIEEIVDVGTTGRDVLFFNAKNWLFSMIKPGEDIIYLGDTQHDCIVFIGYINLKNRARGGCDVINCRLNFKLILQFKEGQYKYSIDNLMHSYSMVCGQYGNYPVRAPIERIKFPKNKKNEIIMEADQKLRSLIAALKKAVSRSDLRETWLH